VFLTWQVTQLAGPADDVPQNDAMKKIPEVEVVVGFSHCLLAFSPSFLSSSYE
jgi:hypothetical protein